jgi:RNA 2',3'-cyclic 3'-phosphodiesterase
MRVFIAIDLPETVHSALADAQQNFRDTCHGARWTRPDDIHLTLKFLGNISDAQTGQIADSLNGLGPLEPFTIEVKGFGFFPHAGRPRVFWAGLAAPPALAVLAGRVEAEMEKLGFAREKRAYSPHLTLARFNTPRSQPALQTAVAKQTTTSLGSFQVSEFFLFESKLSPQGAHYQKIMRFPKSSGSWQVESEK